MVDLCHPVATTLNLLKPNMVLRYGFRFFLLLVSPTTPPSIVVMHWACNENSMLSSVQLNSSL